MARMDVLLLGAGMQGKAALFDLINRPENDTITVADMAADALSAWLRDRGWDSRVKAIPVDGRDAASLARAMSRPLDVVIDLQPKWLAANAARAAIARGVPLVNATFSTPEFKALDASARAAGVTLLPEFGLDPGLDLVMLGDAARSLDVVDEIHSYGSGIPEWSAADNPLHYKISWSFEGVLDAYRRPARVVKQGMVVDIASDAIFAPANVSVLDFPGLGALEAYPNGDAVECADALGIEAGSLTASARYTLRWPGHCAFWGNIVALGLLDHEPVVVDGTPVDRMRYLARALAPKLQYQPGERDLAIVRVDVIGRVGGRRKRIRHEVIDQMDLGSGLSAMSRCVGFPIAVAARMLASGRLKGPGLLSPARDVAYAPLAQALRARGLDLRREETWL